MGRMAGESPEIHPMDCACDACLCAAFGSPDELPPDFEEQMDAIRADLGIPTVSPEEDDDGR